MVLRPWSARNTMGVGGACPPEELPVLLELLGLALREARFEEGEIARTRADFEEGRRMVMDDAGMLAEELVWRGLFPGHAWGRPSTGSAAANARLSAARLRRLSERVFCGENLVLAVSGDIDPQALRRMVRAHLGALPRGKALLPDPPAQPLSARRRRASVPRADSPAHLMIGLRAAGHGQPEEAAWQVLAGLLGGASGGAGRLFLRLREDLGLAYEVGASLQRGLGGGALICSIAADPSREAMAREGLWGELERLAQQGPAPGEVERVARGIVEGAVLGLQSSAARADHLATHERLGPGAELAEEHGRRPLSVRPEEVAALAKRALRRELAVEVRVGPRAAGQADEAE
jgi:zinc protease